MATFYVDFENGNDVNDGTTFANRWKTLTSGATAARIAPGDTVRIMGSPAPTSLGQNGVWTSQALQATKSISSSTNATPIAITCTAHGYSTGDTVAITSHTINTNANGTWEITVTGANTFTLDGSVGNGVGGGSGTVRLRNNTRVMLTTAVTQNIASTGPKRAAWTSAAGVAVTTAFDTAIFKEHNQADSIAVTASFSTGLAAYWALPSTLNLSGYQQVSFWIRQTVGNIGAAGAVDLRLCSDTAGVTAVNTISIPSLGVISRWMPITVNLGTNLGSSIRSIALYVNTDNGAQTFLLNNIIACKASSAADSLTLTSLIGKNTSGETFWGIQSINGRRVMLDAQTNSLPTDSTVRGYYGTSETATTWKRETIKIGPFTTTTETKGDILDSGTEGSLLVYSGGWDRTNMSTQNLETWLDGVNGNGYGLQHATGRQFVQIEKIAFTRLNTGLNQANSILGTTGCVYRLVAANNCTSTAVRIDSNAQDTIIDHACANSATAVNTSGYGSGQVELKYGLSNGSTALFCVLSNNARVKGTRMANNGIYGINFDLGSQVIFSGCELVDNTTSGINAIQSHYLSNCLVTDSTEITFSGLATTIFSHSHDQVAGNHKIFMNGALISAATDQRHTASGISWKIQPTSVNRNSACPVILSLAKVACAANSLVTIKAWMRRDNSGLTMRLVCKGSQIAGVTNDVTASVATTNAWEEETITFTPTEAGVVEITVEAWGGTTFSGWVDDMTISQA